MSFLYPGHVIPFLVVLKQALFLAGDLSVLQYFANLPFYIKWGSHGNVESTQNLKCLWEVSQGSWHLRSVLSGSAEVSFPQIPVSFIPFHFLLFFQESVLLFRQQKVGAAFSPQFSTWERRTIMYTSGTKESSLTIILSRARLYYIYQKAHHLTSLRDNCLCIWRGNERIRKINTIYLFIPTGRNVFLEWLK